MNGCNLSRQILVMVHDADAEAAAAAVAAIASIHNSYGYFVFLIDNSIDFVSFVFSKCGQVWMYVCRVLFPIHLSSVPYFVTAAAAAALLLLFMVIFTELPLLLLLCFSFCI